MLVRLSSKLETYKGKAWLYKLVNGQNVHDLVFGYAMNQLGKGYDFPAIKNIAKNILGIAYSKVINSQDDNSFICSELVGRVFQEANLVDKRKSASLMSPRDVTEFECLNKSTQLL